MKKRLELSNSNKNSNNNTKKEKTLVEAIYRGKTQKRPSQLGKYQHQLKEG